MCELLTRGQGQSSNDDHRSRRIDAPATSPEWPLPGDPDDTVVKVLGRLSERLTQRVLRSADHWSQARPAFSLVATASAGG